jgi:hypothetical protein
MASMIPHRPVQYAIPKNKCGADHCQRLQKLLHSGRRWARLAGTGAFWAIATDDAEPLRAPA